MKKIVILFVIITSAIITKAQSVSSENGMVKFNSINDYTTAAESNTSRASLKSTTESFTGVAVQSKTATAAISEEIPEFLLSILNADNMFQIGGFIIKMDFANERLLVINKNVTNAYATLQGNQITQSDVMVLPFATTDNVFEFFEGLENGNVSAANYLQFIGDDGITARCKSISDAKIKERRVWSTLKMEENRRNHFTPAGQDCTGDDIDYKYDYKIVYQNLLIYFRLVGKAKGEYMCSGTNPIAPYENTKDMHMSGKIVYTLKCSDTYSEGFDQANYTRLIEWKPYEGWRKVTKLDWDVECQQKHTWEATFNHNIPLSLHL